MAALPWETKTEAKSKLTQVEANARATAVSGLHYAFHIVLTKVAPSARPALPDSGRAAPRTMP